MSLCPLPYPGRPKLVVPRVSDRRIREDLYDMTDASLRPWRGYPEVDWIASLPPEIVQHTATGARLREQYGVEVMTPPGRRKVIGFLIRRGDWYCLIVPDSASKEADDGTNDFVELLVRLLDRIKPGMLAVAEFKRAVRSFSYGGQTFQALRRQRCTVVEGGTVWLDPWAPDAELMFGVKTIGSSADRAGTTERLLHGQLHDLERGRWPFDELYLPDGYRVARDSEGRLTGRPELVSKEASVVRKLIQLGASDLSEAEIADKIGPRLVAPRATLQRRRATGDNSVFVMVSELAYPEVAIKKRFARYLDAWATGTYRVEYTNPTYSEQARGISAHRDSGDPRDRGRFVFEIDLGGKISGLSKATVEEARRRRVHRETADRTPTGAATHGRARKPLTGMPDWDTDRHNHHVGGERKDYYSILERPLADSYDDSGRRKGWRKGSAQVQAVASSAELHVDMARAIRSIDPDSHGSPAPAPARARFVSHDARAHEQRRKEVQDRIDLLKGRIKSCVTQAADAKAAGDEDGFTQYDEARREYTDELKDLEATLRTDVAVINDPPSSEEVGFTSLAAVVAGLERFPSQAPVELCEAIAHFIRRLRFTWTPNVIHWTADLVLQLESGELCIDLSGSVPNRKNNSAPNHCRKERTEELARLYLDEGQSLDEVASASRLRDGHEIERRLRSWLEPKLPSKGLRAALLDCPIADVRRVLWAHLTRSPVPDGIDMRWAKHVARIYMSDSTWSYCWAGDTHVFRRQAVNIVTATGPNESMAIDDLVEALSSPIGKVRTLLDEYSVGSTNRTRPYGPTLERTLPWGKQCTLPREDRRVRARHCAHCGEAALHVLRVPELPGDLLCTACRRPATGPRIPFPEEYLLPWAGPRGTGSGRLLGPLSGTTLALDT